MARGIHGLRGLAVLAVIVFHAHVTHLPGGWLGVDVFFTVSGFLITRQLLDGGLRSLGSFYARRAARILPALWLLLIACAVLAPLNRGGPQLVKPALLFVSNLSLAGEIQMRLADPLQHTWSLAQEEQFYLVWPVALLLLRIRGRALALLLTGASVGVLYLNWRHGSYADPIQHSAPLLAGCALAASGCRCDVRGVGWAGIAILAVVAYLYSDAHYQAFEVLITLGAAMTLAGVERLKVLFQRPFQVAGTYSYGLYLWHVPLLFAYRPLALPITAVVAGASYHLVELPIRNAVRRAAWVRLGREALGPAHAG